MCGFTLSELLIALAILGLLAAFTIPKVLQATDEQASSARLKDTLQILSQITNEGRLSEALRSESLISYMEPRLNYSKKGGLGHPDGDLDNGWLLHNGVIVADQWGDDSSPPSNPNDVGYVGFVVDLNGVAAPNEEGTDILYLQICIGFRPSNTCNIQYDDIVDSWIERSPLAITPSWCGTRGVCATRFKALMER